jgi:hypothetical protein
VTNPIPLSPQPLAAKSNRVGQTALSRLLAPSFSDCLFLAVLFWLFASGEGGWMGLLADCDTGWHIRTGEWVLANGKAPTVDLFSFSKAGQPWFAWEWLTDVWYAILHGFAGLKALLIFSSIVLAGFGTILFRHLIWKGANPFVALGICLLVFGASTIHFLARPHVITLLFLTISLWLIDSDRRSPSRRLWLLIPLTVIWVNTHGGFLSLVACCGLLLAGTLAEQLWSARTTGKQVDLTPVRRYATLLAGCVAASLVNPYGWHLHAHVAQYLQSDWIKNNIVEFMAPRFRSESDLQFELMLFLSIISAAALIRRRDVVPALWILFWAHSALGSVRHIPLFMIVASPWVAILLTELWDAMAAGAAKNSVRSILVDFSRDIEPACRRTSVWAGIALLVLCLAPDSMLRWPTDFPSQKFPVTAAAKHGPWLQSGRLLTQDQWADYLIYHFYPAQKVFLDGRSDFFGPQIGSDYVGMAQGRWDWEELMNKHGFDRVLSPVNWPLAALLKRHPQWKLIDDTGQALLFERTVGAPVQ